ncbi:MAG: NAD(P)/FAD-dependent oxidoreductase [Candidatus Levybacteria bacterium]|nr:NAD(P)/FAD-dependent oxidoreductase [Candidatus Levybacteria bacterium]
MKVAIVGAGFTGLSAAYELIKYGHQVTVFERDEKPGGLAIGFSHRHWQWTLEAHYHHWFTNDTAVLSLAKEINFPVLIKRPKTSMYLDGSVGQFDSPLSVLTYSKLSVLSRLRIAGVIGLLRYNPFWQPLEAFHANTFLERAIGKEGYKKIWEPLLVGKFGKQASDVSLAWFWARVRKRTPSLAYPEGGFLQFARALQKAIEQQGGTIHFNTDVAEIKSNKDVVIKFKRIGNSSASRRIEIRNYDAVVVTLPSFLFLRIAPQLPPVYRNQLTQLKGLGAINLILRLSKPFLLDNTYWLNICDQPSPILAVVEHTNFMEKKYYNNEHIVYLGNYLPQDHRYFQMDENALLKEFDPLLKKINPHYKKQIIGAHRFVTPFAQPIIPINYSKIMPSFVTPLRNVYLANIQQVYPWDRGTNYAVELGEKVAKLI